MLFLISDVVAFRNIPLSRYAVCLLTMTEHSINQSIKTIYC